MRGDSREPKLHSSSKLCSIYFIEGKCGYKNIFSAVNSIAVYLKLLEYMDIGGRKGGTMGLQPHLISECSIGFLIEILFGQQISPT